MRKDKKQRQRQCTAAAAVEVMLCPNAPLAGVGVSGWCANPTHLLLHAKRHGLVKRLGVGTVVLQHFIQQRCGGAVEAVVHCAAVLVVC